MNRSTNLNLYLPENSDYRDVSVLTANFETLDSTIGALPSGKNLQGQIEEIISKKNIYLGTVTASTRAECMQEFSDLLNSTFAFSSLSRGTVISGAFTWQGIAYCAFTATRTDEFILYYCRKMKSVRLEKI